MSGSGKDLIAYLDPLLRSNDNIRRAIEEHKESATHLAQEISGVDDLENEILGHPFILPSSTGFLAMDIKSHYVGDVLGIIRRQHTPHSEAMGLCRELLSNNTKLHTKYSVEDMPKTKTLRIIVDELRSR